MFTSQVILLRESAVHRDAIPGRNQGGTTTIAVRGLGFCGGPGMNLNQLVITAALPPSIRASLSVSLCLLQLLGSLSLESGSSWSQHSSISSAAIQFNMEINDIGTVYLWGTVKHRHSQRWGHRGRRGHGQKSGCTVMRKHGETWRGMLRSI